MNPFHKPGLALLAIGTLLIGCQTQSTTSQQETQHPSQQPEGSAGTQSQATSGDVETEADASATATPSPASEAANGARERPSAQQDPEALDERFTASVSEFDRMILTERTRIRDTAAQEDSMAGGGGHDGGYGADGDAGTEPFEAGDQGYPGSSPGVPDDTESASSQQPRSGQLPGRGDGNQENIPADIPSGEDDDIVARQIREAAINEPDPELREKLWDEYRRYKGLK